MKFQSSIVYVCFIGLAISCAEGHKPAIVDAHKIEDHNQALHKPPSSFTDTVKISSPAAVFYHPDSLQMIALKKITDSGIIKSTVHENFYQMRYSRIVLKKYYPRVKIIEVTNARYLFFKKADGKNELVDLDTKNDPFGLIVFDGHKASQLLDMTNIETELSKYFTAK